jgi:hypothetical protein
MLQLCLGLIRAGFSLGSLAESSTELGLAVFSRYWELVAVQRLHPEVFDGCYFLGEPKPLYGLTKKFRYT